MARREVIDLIDDLDGSLAAETIPFAFDGKPYSVDLSAGNAEVFREFMGQYIAASKNARRQVVRHRRPAPTGDVRAWALKNGMQVSKRGAIPREIREAYEKVRPR